MYLHFVWTFIVPSSTFMDTEGFMPEPQHFSLGLSPEEMTLYAMGGIWPSVMAEA